MEIPGKLPRNNCNLDMEVGPEQKATKPDDKPSQAQTPQPHWNVIYCVETSG